MMRRSTSPGNIWDLAIEDIFLFDSDSVIMVFQALAEGLQEKCYNYDYEQSQSSGVRGLG